MAGRVLYIGSSLTSAFIARNRRRPDAPAADHVVSHGGMWVVGINLNEDVVWLANGRITLARRFAVRKPENRFRVWTDLEIADESEVSIDPSAYSAVVFTVPLLFRVFSLDLWKGGYFLSSAGVAPTEAEPRLIYPLSDAAFVAMHQAKFRPAYQFLDTLRAVRPDLPVFVTPSILPTVAQASRYPESWRRRHLAEMDLIHDHLVDVFGVIAVRQPRSTMEEDWTTKEMYLADDSHHFNASFVELMEEENTPFGEISCSDRRAKPNLPVAPAPAIGAID